MASGCDQRVWAVGVVAGHGHWVGDVISVCLKLSNLTSLSCFHYFFQLHHDPSSTLHHI